MAAGGLTRTFRNGSARQSVFDRSLLAIFRQLIGINRSWPSLTGRGRRCIVESLEQESRPVNVSVNRHAKWWAGQILPVTLPCTRVPGVLSGAGAVFTAAVFAKKEPKESPSNFAKTYFAMLFRFRLLLLALCFTVGLVAQDCNYQLILNDSFGDGWDGAEVIVRVNGVANAYTITDDPMIDDGARRIIFFPVADGDTLEVGFNEGAMPEEHSFSLLGNDDEPLFVSTTPIEEADILFATRVVCLTCFSPPTNSVDLFRVRFNSVDYRFNPVNPIEEPTYRIEYGEGDFDPAVAAGGTTLLTQDTSGRITDLMSDTRYTFWVSTICQATMDTTERRGPFVIMTQKRADVGVTMIGGPDSDCDLGFEMVTIGITNFGGEAQAFFNVDYAINGAPAGVERPTDGIFTGVVGVDSTEFFTFDTPALLTAPGNYEITLWTELEGDEDTSNDTMSFTVTHTPLIEELPYFQDFEANNGFWYSDAEDFSAGNSWEWGEPAGEQFDRAPAGRSAWATNLLGAYGADEVSYLYSPCFDFSELTEAPLFSAVLQLNTEENFDHLSLEITKDDGETWETVENSAGTIFWYNNLQQQFWTGDGAFPDGGPVMISAVLSGTAGEEIQLRFRFESDDTGFAEGVVLDVVSITERYADDLAAVVSSVLALDTCGAEQDTIVFSFANRGQNFATDFPVNYRVNGGTTVTETFMGSVAPGQARTYRFNTLFNATSSAVNRIEAWTELPGDAEIGNDTTVFFFSTIGAVPFVEDFDDALVPESWALDAGLTVATSAGSSSPAITGTLAEMSDSLGFRTSNYGLIEAGDELWMDLHFRSPDGLPFTGPVDVTVHIYAGCTEVPDVLDTFTATGDTTLMSDLSAYATNFLSAEVILQGAGGDVLVNVDNFGILRCNGLDLIADTDGVSEMGAADGSATIIPGAGFGPYTYDWSNGATTATVDNLAFGDYDVIVTDAFGCAEEIAFTIDLASGADEATALLEGVQVFPNPTDGVLELRLDLPQSTALNAALYDMTGRELLRRNFGRQPQLTESFDLSSLPAGIYLLRIQADNAAKTVRVVRK